METKKTKNLKTSLYYVIILLLSIGLLACSGDDGVDGAMGPQGLAGANGTNGIDGVNGTNGTDGANGTNGTDGNANVFYSNWIPANFTGTLANIKYMGINFPSGMPSAFSIKNTHSVFVYFTGYGDGNVYLLPVLDFRGAQFTYGWGSGSGSASDINLTAKALSGDLTNVQIDPTLGAKFRYIIIPGGVLSGKMAQQNLTKMTYDVVCESYNIPK